MTTTTLRRDTVRATGTSTVLEQRTTALLDADLRVTRADDDEPRRFQGHAAVVNSRTEIGDPLKWGWYEQIAPGAFDKTLAEGDARFLIDHNSSLLIARVSAGDLRLHIDDVGLAVDSGLDTELSYVRDLVRNLEKRRITGMSFGFYVVRDQWEEVEVEVERDGKTVLVDAWLRTIQEVRLLEVSVVTFPAYEDTDAHLRTIAQDVRAARGVPTELPTPEGGASPAPADATRDTSDPAPAQTTRGVEIQDERAHALAVRYRLSAPDTHDTPAR